MPTFALKWCQRNELLNGKVEQRDDEIRQLHLQINQKGLDSQKDEQLKQQIELLNEQVIDGGEKAQQLERQLEQERQVWLLLL